MRITGVFPRKEQASALVDSLKNMGFRRENMIVTDMVKSDIDYEEDPGEIIDIKTEREGLGEKEPYTDAFEDEVEYGVLVSVEIPEKDAARVMELMEQNGAVKIMKK
ncbi:MAG: hypothetical protein L5655_01875 [Thermosediminibacteraceae bacterium]|nr:hypothetical protein [Thermosediminibacteraceae bacterium]